MAGGGTDLLVEWGGEGEEAMGGNSQEWVFMEDILMLIILIDLEAMVEEEEGGGLDHLITTMLDQK